MPSVVEATVNAGLVKVGYALDTASSCYYSSGNCLSGKGVFDK